MDKASSIRDHSIRGNKKGKDNALTRDFHALVEKRAHALVLNALLLLLPPRQLHLMQQHPVPSNATYLNTPRPDLPGNPDNV